MQGGGLLRFISNTGDGILIIEAINRGISLYL